MAAICCRVRNTDSMQDIPMRFRLQEGDVAHTSCYPRALIGYVRMKMFRLHHSATEDLETKQNAMETYTDMFSKQSIYSTTTASTTTTAQLEAQTPSMCTNFKGRVVAPSLNNPATVDRPVFTSAIRLFHILHALPEVYTQYPRVCRSWNDYKL